MVAGFEDGEPAWEAYHDESTPTLMTCQPESGTGRSGNSLLLDFNIAANSWGTCALTYESPRDWSAWEGISFHFRAAQAGLSFDINLYAGPPDNRETYLYTIETPAESVASWMPMELRWADFHRAAWEENADAPFEKTNEVVGLAFGFGTAEDAPNIGSLHVDDVVLLGAESEPAVPQPTGQPAESPEETPQRRLLPCSGALILPLLLLILPILKSIKRRDG